MKVDRADFEDVFTRILKRQQPRRCQRCGKFFLVPLVEESCDVGEYAYPEFSVRIGGPWECEDCQ